MTQIFWRKAGLMHIATHQGIDQTFIYRTATWISLASIPISTNHVPFVYLKNRTPHAD
ncbi:hypothetical protein DB43_AB00010 [Parachlamydia acanthamoebae]|uniref:Uncharacterized protein n=1 Tax=Parachlamydia acanthamoebae TaxID=83552 RepID=A0A0C1BYJ8_9BACT|nr:hypothetical protein DB43_AB00010 [Parachlamydia acanthamoebae]